MIRLPVAGESFGRYRLLRPLGQGGMGVVHAARDTTLDRDVAVKLVAPQFAADPEFRARFQREAAILAKLDSAHIVHIHDFGEQDGVLFLVTQLIEGGDLLRLITQDGALPPARAVDVVSQVARGLEDAHAVGVVHRDIKPANVLLRGRGSELEAFLCDFGIATTPGADLSRTGTVAGSLPYMAPERHRGENTGPSGDVYAAGCLFWHALTGSAPYAGTDVEVAMGHLQGPIPQLPGKGEFSAAVNALLRKALAKDPQKRLASAHAFQVELQRIAVLAPDAVIPPGSTAYRAALDIKEQRRRRWVPGVVAAAATGAVLLGTLFAAGALDGNRSGGGQEALSGGSGSPSTATKVINEPPVLVPVGSTRTAASWSSRSAAEPEDVPGLVAVERSRTRNPRPQRTKRPATAATTTKPPTSAPPTTTAPPRDPWACWNGTTAATKDACGLPTGWTGATWLFKGLSTSKAIRNCHLKDMTWTGGDVEAWQCVYGKANYINIARWGSTSRAVTDLQKHWSRNATAWRPTRGTSWGYQILRNTDGRDIGVRIYQDVAYSIQWNAVNPDARTWGVKLTGPWRPPSNIKAVRR
ncbi:serine/threonine-protein kinase [Nocardioides jensenii]|uniref:serine/threonine-protein kinase n=1 Tax=Nocardioides jensenii TaxID=1843 RepID=UPI000B048773|nr:serine/threonine-protein kinase [Nocardioides jensenii]